MNNINLLHKSGLQFIRKIAVGSVFAGSVLLGGVAPVLALDDVFAEKIKIIECIGLLFSDPEAHQIQCGIGDVGSFESLVPGGPGSPLLVCESGYIIYDDECVHEYAS